MAKQLKAKLTLDTVKANANARKLKGQIRGVDRELKTVGGSAKGAVSSMVAWGASGVAAAATIIAAIVKVTDALNEQIRAQDRLANKAFGVQGQVAGAATQFGLTPEQTVSLLGPVAQQAGFGAQGFGDISSLATAASSAGLIGQPTVGAGGQATFPGQGADVLATLGGFVQRIGEPGVGGAVAKLVRGGLGTQEATPANVREVLGDVLGAFRGSQSANLAGFLQGAQAGTAGLTAQGVSQRTGLAIFGGLIKQTATERQAAEILRITADKFFTGDDPAMVAAIDAQMGKGTFFRLKKEDPDRLFRSVIGILIGQEGEQRAELFKQLGITSEVGARISNIQTTQEAAGDIRKKMEATTGADILEEIRKVTESGLGIQKAVGAGIVTREVGFGTGGAAQAAAARQLAEAERERFGAESPFGLFLLETLRFGLGAEQESLLRRAVKRQLAKEGFDVEAFPEIQISGEGVTIPGIGKDTPRIKRALEFISGRANRSSGINVNNVIINQQGPESKNDNNRSKSDR